MIKCEICGALVNFIELHLSEAHEGVTMASYTAEFPDSPIMSDQAKEAYDKRVSVLAGNEYTQHEIGALFGIRTKLGSAPTVTGWVSPHWNTPKIDEDYEFSNDLLASVLYTMETHDMSMLLTGPTGCGKTSVVEQACARLNKPVYRMNFDSDVTRAEFVGKTELVDNGNGGTVTRHQYGILPRAMQEGAILILDELDAGDPAVTMAIQAPLDGAPLTLLETGEVIFPHPDFRIFATANTVGQGDESGLYNGTQPQNYATLNRFKLVEQCDYPSPATEMKIITKKTGLTNIDGAVKKLVDVAKIIRSAHKNEDMRGTMSTRTLINTASVYLAFGDIAKAYKLTFINGQNGEDASVAAEAVQRVWGISI